MEEKKHVSTNIGRAPIEADAKSLRGGKNKDHDRRPIKRKEGKVKKNSELGPTVKVIRSSWPGQNKKTQKNKRKIWGRKRRRGNYAQLGDCEGVRLLDEEEEEPKAAKRVEYLKNSMNEPLSRKGGKEMREKGVRAKKKKTLSRGRRRYELGQAITNAGEIMHGLEGGIWGKKTTEGNPHP